MWRAKRWKIAALPVLALPVAEAAAQAQAHAENPPPIEQPRAPDESTQPPAPGEPSQPPSEPSQPPSLPPAQDEPSQAAPPEGSAPEDEPVLEESNEPLPEGDEPYDPSAPLEIRDETFAEQADPRLIPVRDPYRGPFARGRVRLSVLLGAGSNFADNYLIVGAGVGYFWLDGLETSLDGTAWFIGDPFIGTVTPGITYVFHQVPVLHPYLGAFYRHYFISGGFNDLDSYGGRVGANILMSERGFVGIGAVYERLFDCDQGQFGDGCDQWYPELAIAFVF